MFKLMGFCIKLLTFSILILILANSLHWRGNTISDQVKIQMFHAEQSPWIGSIRTWAEKISQDAHKGIQKQTGQFLEHHPARLQEDISSSEKQKLKALIHELNYSHPKTKTKTKTKTKIKGETKSQYN